MLSSINIGGFRQSSQQLTNSPGTMSDTSRPMTPTRVRKGVLLFKLGTIIKPSVQARTTNVG